MKDEQMAKAKTMHDEGMSYRAIGEALGISDTAVARNIDPVRHGKKAAYDAAYRATHKDEAAAYSAVYKVEHKEESAEYRATHKEEKAAYDAAYCAMHKEERAAYYAVYYAAHKDEIAARNTARRALIAGATVGGLAEIAEIYRQAREDEPIRCYLCGELIPLGDREVDHVVPVNPADPLVGPGKNATFNLRIVHSRCNRRKSNKMLHELDWIIST